MTEGRPNWRAGIAVACLLSLALSCEAMGITDSEGPMDQPGFQTPVAQAQELGLKIYWLGESFQVDSRAFEIGGTAALISHSGLDSRLGLNYGASLDLGAVTFSIHTYSSAGEEAKVGRQRIAGLDSSPATSVVSERVTVGRWQGELFSASSATRPVNQLWLFFDVGDALLSVEASAGRSGVPGEDPNPLIQADLLIETVARELRPYPE